MLDEVFSNKDFIASKDKETAPNVWEELPNQSMEGQSDKNRPQPWPIESILVGLVPHICEALDDDCQNILVVLGWILSDGELSHFRIRLQQNPHPDSFIAPNFKLFAIFQVPMRLSWGPRPYYYLKIKVRGWHMFLQDLRGEESLKLQIMSRLSTDPANYFESKPSLEQVFEIQCKVS